MATSPTSGPGGGSGGPASGSYLPSAHAVALDTTTYDDPFGSGKMATLVFPSVEAALALAVVGDAFPRVLLVADGRSGICFGTGAYDVSNGAEIFAEAGAAPGLQIPPAKTGFGAAQLAQVSPKGSITAGALPSFTPSSGVAAQANVSADVEVVVPVTFNPTAGAAATCVVELSPDNVTYTTLGIESEPAGVVFDGTIHLIRVRVPAAWYVKLTVTNATIGTGHYI